MNAHALDTGRLVANKTFLRGEGFGSLLRRKEMVQFPVLAYVIEHPEGLILVDTGLPAEPPRIRRLRGFPPEAVGPRRDVAEVMRERGLDPGDVRTVVLTHLDWDHTGGLARFPAAEVLVHRLDYEFANTRPGRWRYRPDIWPAVFSPTLFDLDDEPLGPFPASRAVTAAGDVRIVGVPGHSPGQVAVVCDDGDRRLVFSADHALRADWFEEDLAAGRLLMLGAFAKEQARETTLRLRDLVRDRPTVLLPSHDDAAPRRLAEGRALTLSG